MQYFGYTLNTFNTDKEIKEYAKNDYVVLNIANLSVFNPQDNIITKLRIYNGNIKVLAYVPFGHANLRSVELATGTIPYNFLDSASHLQASSYNQWMINTGGTSVTYPNGFDNAADTLGILDYSDYGPVDSGGRVFRSWFAEYIATGVAEKYDFDGFFFDQMHNSYDFPFDTNAIDFTRNGVEEDRSVLSGFYSNYTAKFLGELSARLRIARMRIRRRNDYILGFNGNFGNLSNLDLKYYEHFPQTASGSVSYVTATGDVSDVLTSGLMVVLGESTLFGSGTTATGFTPTNETGFKDMRHTLAMAYMFDNTMFHLDSGNETYDTHPVHNSVWYVGSSFKSYTIPLTDPVSTGMFQYRLFNDGLIILNTGESSDEFMGITINSGDSLFIDQDPDINYIHGTEGLPHGFEGILGTGVGKHLNHPEEKISTDFMNKIELAINKASEELEYNFGHFKFDHSDNLFMQYFLANNSQTDFTLKAGVDKWLLSGYDYEGFNPNPNYAILNELNNETNLYYGLSFDQAPSSGYIFLIYNKQKSTSLNSSAYLGG